MVLGYRKTLEGLAWCCQLLQHLIISFDKLLSLLGISVNELTYFQSLQLYLLVLLLDYCLQLLNLQIGLLDGFIKYFLLHLEDFLIFIFCLCQNGCGPGQFLYLLVRLDKVVGFGGLYGSSVLRAYLFLPERLLQLPDGLLQPHHSFLLLPRALI